jgi:hypothetical protein
MLPATPYPSIILSSSPPLLHFLVSQQLFYSPPIVFALGNDKLAAQLVEADGLLWIGQRC